MDMELSKKTTILFSPAQHRRLTRLAKLQHSSIGELVRSACERVYKEVTVEEKLAALKDLSKLNAPVADVRTMKRQSVPTADELLP
jgi:hypothetical protein